MLENDPLLTVDTTGPPARSGVHDQRRSHRPSEVASDVLLCWTGDVREMMITTGRGPARGTASGRAAV